MSQGLGQPYDEGTGVQSAGSGLEPFRGRAVRLSLPWLHLSEHQARNPLRLAFGPLPGRSGSAPEAGVLSAAFAGRWSHRPGGYVIDASHLEPAAEAALWLLRLDGRPAYLLRGADVGRSPNGTLMVAAEEVEAIAPGTPILTSGCAEAFYGELLGEARELLDSVEPLLIDGELAELEAAMYAAGVHLPATFVRIARSRYAARAELVDRSREEMRNAHRKNPLYVRFVEPPAFGRSRDYAGVEEPGVSCFRARREGDGSFVVDAAESGGVLTVFKALAEEERPAYLATGREVGVGGAFEPVLERPELAPLPPGTRVRASEEWQPAATLLYAAEALGGFCYSPRVWRRPEEFVVPDPAPSAPIGSVADVLGEARSRPGYGGSELHGEEHWKRVAVAGLGLAAETHDADALVVLLFALLHDAERLRDARDEHHAHRGARLARRLLEGGPLLDGEKLSALLRAIELHDAGETSEDPTVGVCWDADRLNLWRVGVKPNPRLLSTAAARDPTMIERCKALQDEPAPSWAALDEWYGMIRAEGGR